MNCIDKGSLKGAGYEFCWMITNDHSYEEHFHEKEQAEKGKVQNIWFKGHQEVE